MSKLSTSPVSLSQKDKEAEFETIKRRIHSKLVDKLDLSRVGEMEGDVLRREIRLVVEHLCDTEDTYLNRNERDRLIEEVLDETFGLGPLEMLLKESSISEIMINGPKNVYIERAGKLEKTTVQFRDDKHLMQIIDRIVSKVGRRVDEVCPMADARLPDGSRVNAIIPPLALDGPCLTIRRFGTNPLKLEDLLNYKSLTPEMVMLLEGAMKARLNIIISGGTGSGKTTLLNTLSSFISNEDRIVTIEDAAELQMQQDHVVRLGNAPAEHRRQGPDQGHRPGAELFAYAAGPHHHRRMPRSGNTRHAAGHEYGPRRFAHHLPRQYAPRRHRPSGDDDHDGRFRPADPGDAATDFQRGRPDCANEPHARRSA